MKTSDIVKRLVKNRPITSITLRMPEDVVEDLKRVAPLLGFSGYQPLISQYIGQGLRADLSRLEDPPLLGRLVESLKRHGVDADVIAAAVAETQPILKEPTVNRKDIGQEIMESIRAIKRGEGKRVEITEPDARAAREKSGLTQVAFAALLGVSLRTLQDWEQGRRKPRGPARSLLRVAERHPEALRG